MLSEVFIFAGGVVFGVVLVRYTIGLGTKLIYQIRQDMPLDVKTVQEQQVLVDHTGQEVPKE